MRCRAESNDGLWSCKQATKPSLHDSVRHGHQMAQMTYTRTLCHAHVTGLTSHVHDTVPSHALPACLLQITVPSCYSTCPYDLQHGLYIELLLAASCADQHPLVPSTMTVASQGDSTSYETVQKSCWATFRRCSDEQSQRLPKTLAGRIKFAIKDHCGLS